MSTLMNTAASTGNPVASLGFADLRRRLDLAVPAEARDWLREAADRIAATPGQAAVHSAGAARRCGRGPLDGGWTVDEAARVVLLHAVVPEQRAAVARDVYTRGDPAERRAVLKALTLLDLDPAAGLAIVEDALRTNDASLIAAALGPFAAAHLPQPAVRQAVLKCAFLAVPFAELPEVMARADIELAVLLADYARERILAGREVDDQILGVVAAFSEVAAALAVFTADLVAADDHRAGFRTAAAQRAAERLTTPETS